MTAGGFVRVLARLSARVFGCAALPVAVIALLLAPVLLMPAAAQDATGDYGIQMKPGSQMLVEADQLVYDYDNNTISAVGNVKIYYVGYTLESERVIYYKITAKLIATGGVKLTDPSGIVLYAEQIDITDDFRDGFVNSLRVDTPDRTHFAAEEAERLNGERTVFVNGVYTACEPCKEHPERPPLWQVKAAKIVVDHREKMIYFHNASIEFFGVPLAWVPYFSTADPSVKRKTGLLAPNFGYSDILGWSVTTPYFIALAPSYDVTLTPTYYSKQGFLGEVEWRQRLAYGQYTLRMAGISQNDPKAFLTSTGGGTYAQRTFRGGIRSTGEFDINQYWTFGWDGTISTDRTVTRDYGVLNEDTAITTSEAHLTGLRDRNYFDVRAEHFQVLTDKTTPTFSQGRQADITPIVDYNRIFDNPVLGGQLSLTSNVTVLSRNQADPFKVNGMTYYRGLAGDYIRATKELDWEKRMVAPGGQLVTTFASLRGDFFSLNPNGVVPPQLTSQTNPTRFMPAAGVEWSWPIMASVPGSTHVIEPMAQLIVRPNEPLAGKLENDDAQSLVFDDSILMRRDKFSGDDRVEGGTRVNYGIRYIGTFDNGYVLDGMFGQSQMVAGKNSFAVSDIADVGAYSGLETPISDYVGRVSLDTGDGTVVSLRGRFDDKNFSVNRGEIQARKSTGVLTASASYVYLREQPTAGITTPTSMITGSASLQLFDGWRAFASAVYDLTNSNLRKDSLGLAYDNSCVSLSIAYSETRGTDIPDRKIMMKLLLRTLAEGQVTSQVH